MKTLISLFLAATLIHPVEAKTHRSYAVKAEFKRLNPCPANGNRRGPDAVNNMQWLTVEEHKAKTKREAGMCRR